MTIDQVLERFHARPAGPDRWRWKCPVHGGRSLTSLSVSRGADGRTLVKCWSGCAVESICEAVGLRVSDLFVDHDTPRPPASPELKSVQKVLADLWPRLTPMERAVQEPIVLRTTAKNVDAAIADALALAVEGEIVQIAMIEGNE
jgi:hypothetical protein